MTFADNVLPPTFAVYEGRTTWLDTELLPVQSTLESIVTNTHYSLLRAHLAGLKPRRTLQDAYEYSPTVRSLAFTLQVTFPSIQRGKQPLAEVHYHRGVERIQLPKVMTIREVNYDEAMLQLEVWQLQNGYIENFT